MEIVLVLSHLVFDGYSLDRLFSFLDELASDAALEYAVDDFSDVNNRINRRYDLLFVIGKVIF